MQDHILKYVRDENNVPFAALAAVPFGETIHIGWSLCSPKDTFTKKKGRYIALERARKPVGRPLPSLNDRHASMRVWKRRHQMHVEAEALKRRAERYFYKLQPSSEICRTTHCQNCGCCDDLSCCDNCASQQ